MFWRSPAGCRLHAILSSCAISRDLWHQPVHRAPMPTSARFCPSSRLQSPLRSETTGSGSGYGYGSSVSAVSSSIAARHCYRSVRSADSSRAHCSQNTGFSRRGSLFWFMDDGSERWRRWGDAGMTRGHSCRSQTGSYRPSR